MGDLGEIARLYAWIERLESLLAEKEKKIGDLERELFESRSLSQILIIELAGGPVE